MIRQPKRLAIFISSMEGGGAQRSMLNLAGGLASRGCRVDLLLARAVGPYLADFPDSVRMVDLGAKRVLESIPALVRYLRSERPNAMLSSMAYVNIVALWARRLARVPTRLVVNEQNTLSSSAAHATKLRNRMTPWLARRFYPWADGIVTVSEGVRDDLAETAGISPEKIDVIYNPSVVRSDVARRARQPVDHPWFQESQPPVVLAVGRLHPQKDYPTLIRAMAKVRRRRDARLVILGEGELRPELEALVRQQGLEHAVDLPSFVDNPFAHMARASLFVLSSRWEGLPTVLVEALCCGVGVVATDCPSGPREILRDPSYGRLVPVGNVDALAGAIESALTDDGPKPPEASWTPFELEAVVDRYLNLLTQV